MHLFLSNRFFSVFLFAFRGVTLFKNIYFLNTFSRWQHLFSTDLFLFVFHFFEFFFIANLYLQHSHYLFVDNVLIRFSRIETSIFELSMFVCRGNFNLDSKYVLFWKSIYKTRCWLFISNHHLSGGDKKGMRNNWILAKIEASLFVNYAHLFDSMPFYCPKRKYNTYYSFLRK